MSQNDLDRRFGPARLPTHVDDWEDRKPDSWCILDPTCAIQILSLLDLARSTLLSAFIRSVTMIWCVDIEGRILIAVEELAIVNEQTGFSGYPRLRGFGHLRDMPKLGHPTLVTTATGKYARIAGELSIDLQNEGAILLLNFNSGRYCRETPPTLPQMQHVADELVRLGLPVQIDDI